MDLKKKDLRVQELLCHIFGPLTPRIMLLTLRGGMKKLTAQHKHDTVSS